MASGKAFHVVSEGRQTQTVSSLVLHRRCRNRTLDDAEAADVSHHRCDDTQEESEKEEPRRHNMLSVASEAEAVLVIGPTVHSGVRRTGRIRVLAIRTT
jgi:hypothetical protein